MEDQTRIINDVRTRFFPKETENIVRRIHLKILDQLSETKQHSWDKSPQSVNFKTVNEYKEVIYETKLFPRQRSYVAEVNGKSAIDRISFFLGMILDENLDFKDLLSPFDIQRHEEALFMSFFKIEHIFYSLELEKDLIIFSEASWNRNGVFFLFEHDGKISILRLQPPQYYD